MNYGRRNNFELGNYAPFSTCLVNAETGQWNCAQAARGDAREFNSGIGEVTEYVDDNDLNEENTIRCQKSAF